MTPVRGTVRLLRDLTADDRTDLLYVLAAIVALIPWLFR